MTMKILHLTITIIAVTHLATYCSVEDNYDSNDCVSYDNDYDNDYDDIDDYS